MIDGTNEATVRARAYQLWEESGGGHGNHDEHWRRAEAECGGSLMSAAPAADGLADNSVKAERHVDGISPLPAQDRLFEQPRRVKISL